MSEIPEVVFIDKRVARTMETEDFGENDVAFVRQDVHEKAVRSASSRGRETVVQIITNPDGRLVGLSSWGRVWAFVSDTKEDPPTWVLITDELPPQELNS